MATQIDKRIFWPFDISTVTEWPGTRPAGWANHVGTDFAVPQGTPLRATVSGTVYLTWDDGLGAYVLDIVRPDGFVVRNGHLSYMVVADGAWVNIGDYIGNTGGAAGTPGAGLSTGPHLHWELRWNRNWSGPGWVDPRNLTINSFSDLKPEPQPKPPIHGMENDMLVFYAHALGKGKPGWLVLGYTPKPLILVTQAAANTWAKRINKETISTNFTGFRRYLRAAGGTAAQLAKVSQG